MLPSLTDAFLILTHECNLRCRYCFVSQKPEIMTLQTAKEAIDFLTKDGASSKVTLFGGEPMLSFDSVIVPLVEYSESKYGSRVSFSITTNGTLLSRERLNWLIHHNIGLLLSIDGTKETQDYNRPMASGESSFDFIDFIIPDLLKLYPNTTFRSTIIPKTVSGLFAGVTYAHNRGFRSYFCIPNSFETWSDEDFLELDRQVHLFSEYFIEECRSGNRPIFFSTFQRMFNTIRQINESVGKGLHRAYPRCRSCGSCGLGSGHTCAIDPKGNIFTCQELTSNLEKDSPFCIGDIYTGVNQSKREEVLRLYDSVETFGDGCKECLLDSVCDGGCSANNYMINRNLRHMTDVQCHWNRLLLTEAIRVARVLGSEENEIFMKLWEDIV